MVTVHSVCFSGVGVDVGVGVAVGVGVGVGVDVEVGVGVAVGMEVGVAVDVDVGVGVRVGVSVGAGVGADVEVGMGVSVGVGVGVVVSVGVTLPSAVVCLALSPAAKRTSCDQTVTWSSTRRSSSIRWTLRLYVPRSRSPSCSSVTSIVVVSLSAFSRFCRMTSRPSTFTRRYGSPRPPESAPLRVVFAVTSSKRAVA